MALWEYLGAGSAVSKGLYRLNGNANDSSWNSNNGTATNVTWVWGKIGSGAGSFNGSSSKIDCWQTLYFTRTADVTYSCWFKTTNSGTNKFIFNQRAWTGQDTQYHGQWFFMQSWELHYYYVWANNNQWQIKATQTYNDGIWHNYIAVKVGTNPNNWNIYFDGKLLSKTVPANTLSTDPGNGTATIGYCYGNGQNYFDGSIDELIIENRAWTASEVRKYYTYSKGRFWIT